MTEPLSDSRLTDLRQWADRLAEGECNGCRIAAKGLEDLLDEVARLKAYPAALERTESGRTGPFRLGSLAALMCSLIQGRYAEFSESPKAMTRILRDVADIYRGLVEAGGDDASQFFPSLPPLSSDEAESLWRECLTEARP